MVRIIQIQIQISTIANKAMQNTIPKKNKKNNIFIANIEKCL